MLQELLKDHQLGHSEFQDDYFITIRAGGTKYGQYKQALRELYKRFRGLREEMCDREKLEVEIEEQKYLSENGKDEFEKRKSAIEFKRKSLQMEESERSIKETKREFERFYQQSVCLKNQIGDLTEEKRDKLDKEMWEFKVKEMAIIDLATSSRIGRNTFEFIHSLPKDMKEKLLPEIKDQERLLEWYENKDEEYLKDLPELKIDYNNLLLN